MVRFVLGLVGSIISGIGLAIVLIVAFFIGILFSALLPVLIVLAVIFVFCLIVMNVGLGRKRVIDRLSKYSAALLDKANIAKLEDLTSATGFLPGLIKSDMRKLKRWGLHFDLYTDAGETTLMKGEPAYLDYIETEKKREMLAHEEAEREARLRNPETQPLEAFLYEGRAMLEKIRAANIMLPGDDISNILYKLERTAKRIFDHIETHPEKLQDTRKLMNYHLPTTLKLVEKYCQYDAMEYQPENIILAKRDIEKALTTADAAFNNFLHGLYAEDTLDATTEAEVLTKMFEKDGLMGSNFDITGKK
ncbi:membrane protein [Clostridia bacterium]|nr:membrane protein [Clostridia bacterium]